MFVFAVLDMHLDNLIMNLKRDIKCWVKRLGHLQNILPNQAWSKMFNFLEFCKGSGSASSKIDQNKPHLQFLLIAIFFNLNIKLVYQKSSFEILELFSNSRWVLIGQSWSRDIIFRNYEHKHWYKLWQKFKLNGECLPQENCFDKRKLLKLKLLLSGECGNANVIIKKWEMQPLLYRAIKEVWKLENFSRNIWILDLPKRNYGPPTVPGAQSKVGGFLVKVDGPKVQKWTDHYFCAVQVDTFWPLHFFTRDCPL